MIWFDPRLPPPLLTCFIIHTRFMHTHTHTYNFDTSKRTPLSNKRRRRRLVWRPGLALEITQRGARACPPPPPRFLPSLVCFVSNSTPLPLCTIYTRHVTITMLLKQSGRGAGTGRTTGTIQTNQKSLSLFTQGITRARSCSLSLTHTHTTLSLSFLSLSLHLNPSIRSCRSASSFADDTAL